MENKLKHLEFIQGVIMRMNSNSFQIKGWGITLISALFALASQGANKDYVLVTYIIIPTFWTLDGFFLSQERQYRALYNRIRAINEGDIDFDMNAKEFNKGRNTWLASIFSKTFVPFYLITIMSVLVVMFLIK